MSDSDSPRLATLDDDGWALDDAEERLAQGTGLYWIPDRWIRDHLEEHVPTDGQVKLLFRILDSGDPTPAIERMWVTLSLRDGSYYHGHLSNEPQTRGAAREGMPVWFRAEHIIDYAGPAGESKASEQADVVQCGTHGISIKCYVCEHLTLDSAGRGFNSADPDVPRPDAWCDECHREFLRTGSWEEPGTREPNIRIVCGGCYDSLKESHSR